MEKILFTLLSLSVFVLGSAQSKTEKETAEIIAEGKKLYRSEMASWYGTDIFLQKFSARKADIGGYFSYTENEVSKCIFFAKGEDPKVIGTIAFDSTYSLKSAMADGTERAFTEKERDLFVIRKAALAEINANELFKVYKNSNLNIIPLIENGEKKVYVLTGPTESNVVVFGNDYLITFDKKNKLVKSRQLHANIMHINYSKETDEAITMHSHVEETGEQITATDVCTLMLYEKFAKWKQHIVVSEEFVSMWNCDTDTMFVITRKAWDKIAKDQEERRKKPAGQE